MSSIGANAQWMPTARASRRHRLYALVELWIPGGRHAKRDWGDRAQAMNDVEAE
jgi:hypothetical protein